MWGFLARYFALTANALLLPLLEPGPRWGAYSTPTGHLAGFKGRGKGNDRRGLTVGRQARGRKRVLGKEDVGRGGIGGWYGELRLPLSQISGSASVAYVYSCTVDSILVAVDCSMPEVASDNFVE